MNDKAKQLTPLQKTLLLRRMQALKADFKISGVLVQTLDGEEISIGTVNFHAATNPIKRKGTKKPVPGYVHGTLTTLVTPWVRLAVENPGEHIKVRLQDIHASDTTNLETVTLRRFAKRFSSKVCHTYGKGKAHVQTIWDETTNEPVLHLWIVKDKKENLHTPKPMQNAGQPLNWPKLDQEEEASKNLPWLS